MKKNDEVDVLLNEKTEKKGWFGFSLLIVLVLGMSIGWAGMVYFMPTNPLGQYINTRTCDFISMGGFQSAVCEDGTVWSVSPFQE